MTEMGDKLKLALKDKKSEAPLAVGTLSKELGKSEEDPMLQEHSIVLRMQAGKPPVIEFGGFWTGKFIRAAQNAIAKAYRTRRHQFIGRV